MKPSICTDWTAAKAKAFTREPVSFRHRLQHRLMFTDAALLDVLKAYPREKLGVFTMGDDPANVSAWRPGLPGDLSPAELLEAVRTGRLWLSMQRVERYAPDYAELCAEIIDDHARFAPHSRTFGGRATLIIGSPNAHDTYHARLALGSLWQLRGSRSLWLYPSQAPFVREEDLERIVRREAGPQIAYDTSFDDAALRFDLEPGMMVTWPQGTPRRMVNGDGLNVSLAVDFMTPRALARANVLYANGKLRRDFGMRPGLQEGLHPAAIGKAALAKMWRAFDGGRRQVEAPRPQFRLARAAA